MTNLLYVTHKSSYTVIINIDILTVTAKSFPCALWSVPFYYWGRWVELTETPLLWLCNS